MSAGDMGNGETAETLVLHALEEQARPGDVILQGVRFTDPKNGDVEADFLVLMPELGVAVVEVKGGHVTYSDGEWTLTGIDNPKYRRSIQPVAQARKAKHSLRRYLDRQPEWSLGLIRSAWFVAMPDTTVGGDFGPEGLQDQMIGAQDVSRLRQRFTAVLDRGLLTEPRPNADHIEDAISLLFRSNTVSIKHMERPAGPSRRFGKRPAIAIGVAALALGGLGFAVWGITGGVGGQSCSMDYEPCIPVVGDMNCPEIGTQVRVMGDDPYNLDADGNGIGCESYPEPELP